MASKPSAIPPLCPHCNFVCTSGDLSPPAFWSSPGCGWSPDPDETPVYSWRGWKVTSDERRPETGRREGERFGVVVSAGSLDALIRIIETRIKERPSTLGA